jgi:fido (protein-threonine AMPylation protein)
MSDPYVDPQSGILTNKFGLTDQESLDRAESDSVSVRSILLQLNPLKGNFDSEHRKTIHSYLFRDVYDFSQQVAEKRGLHVGGQTNVRSYLCATELVSVR